MSRKRLSKDDVKAAADRAEARSKGSDVTPAPTPLDPPESKSEFKDKATGRFLPGNKFWEARSSHGPKPKFTNPGDLWAACCEYFTWVDQNPLWEDRLVTFQGTATHEPAAKMRAMTIAGLCLFLDVDQTTWREWKTVRSDLSPVITRAEAVVYAQKFAGAAADLLNANIIARDLGLSDKNEITGKDGGPIQLGESDDVDQARRVAFALGRVLERQRAKVLDAP